MSSDPHSIYPRKGAGLCEDVEGGDVVLYPGGRFFRGVRLTEQEIQAERVEVPKRTWGQALLRFCLVGILIYSIRQSFPDFMQSIFFILAMTYIFYSFRKRFNALREKYPEHQWTARTPFQRECSGEVILPKYEEILIPICLCVVSIGIYSCILFVSNPITRMSISLISPIIYMSLLAITWVLYTIIFSWDRTPSP